MGLVVFCLRATPPPHHRMPAGGAQPRKGHLVVAEESALWAVERSERLAGRLRLRKNAEWLPATVERRQCPRAQGVLRDRPRLG